MRSGELAAGAILAGPALALLPWWRARTTAGTRARRAGIALLAAYAVLGALIGFALLRLRAAYGEFAMADGVVYFVLVALAWAAALVAAVRLVAALRQD